MKKISIAVIVFAHLLIELSAVDADDCCFPSDVSIAAKGKKEGTKYPCQQRMKHQQITD
jgi:hypothetical protein